jgi:hypothetical protein
LWCISTFSFNCSSCREGFTIRCDGGRRSQDGLTTIEQEELRRLRRENRTLREEREILRKVRVLTRSLQRLGQHVRQRTRSIVRLVFEIAQRSRTASHRVGPAVRDLSTARMKLLYQGLIGISQAVVRQAEAAAARSRREPLAEQLSVTIDGQAGRGANAGPRTPR